MTSRCRALATPYSAARSQNLLARSFGRIIFLDVPLSLSRSADWSLVPELRYDDLPINEGRMASLELERMLFQGAELTEEAKAQLRTDLLRYCHQDTWGLVKLLLRLRELARS